MVTAKPTVVLDPLTPAHARLISILEQVSQLCEVDLRITCGREGHGDTDPHTRGEALDVSVRDLANATIVRMWHLFRAMLGPAWTVLYECPTPPTTAALIGIAYVNAAATAPHFHLQPRKGTRWPPQPSIPVTDV